MYLDIKACICRGRELKLISSERASDELQQTGSTQTEGSGHERAERAVRNFDRLAAKIVAGRAVGRDFVAKRVWDPKRVNYQCISVVFHVSKRYIMKTKSTIMKW